MKCWLYNSISTKVKTLNRDIKTLNREILCILILDALSTVATKSTLCPFLKTKIMFPLFPVGSALHIPYHGILQWRRPV